MKKFFTKNTYINLFYTTFIIALLYKLIHDTFIVGYSKESWNITEWIINYEGGFVRRGLFGEILLYLNKYLHFDPYITILIFCVALYFILILFFLKAFLRNGISFFILPFVFFLGNPVIQNYLIRKDILLVLIFIIIIYWTTKKNKLYFLLINLLLIVGILSHEIIAFFCFPILFLLLINKFVLAFGNSAAVLKSSIISFLILSPSILVFFIVSHFHGSQKIALDVWNSWNHIKFPIDNHTIIPATEVDALIWSAKDAILISVRNLINFDGGLYAPIVLLISITSVYYIFININKIDIKIFNIESKRNIDTAYLSEVFIFQLICLIPMFIICCDYSRLIFFWVTSSFAVYLLIPDKGMRKIFPLIISNFTISINSFLRNIFPESKGSIIMICLLVGYSPFDWDLLTSINSSAFIITLQFVSLIVKYLFYFIFSSFHLFDSLLKHLIF